MRPLILCVDDEQDITDLVKFHLVRSGYDVVAAASCREAMFAVNEHRPALILLDLMLPDVDGFSALELLRQEAGQPAIPVVILTAWATSEAHDTGLGLGAAEYLVKPFDMSQLTTCVSRLLNTAQVAPRSCSHGFAGFPNDDTYVEPDAQIRRSRRDRRPASK